MQSEQPKLPLLLERIISLYKILLKCFIKRDLLEKCPIEKINVKNPNNYIELENMFFGAKVDALLSQDTTIEKQEIHNFRLNALSFFIELTTQLKERFDFNDIHLKYASNFTPTNATAGKILSIANFVNLFPSVEIDIESANAEWLLLNEMSNDFDGNLDITSFWKKVNCTKNELGEFMFLNLMKIVKVILALPHSSAAAERAFSNLTLVKSKLRNSLLISTCAAILLVKDEMRNVPGGFLEWKPSKELLKYNQNTIENITIE